MGSPYGRLVHGLYNPQRERALKAVEAADAEFIDPQESKCREQEEQAASDDGNARPPGSGPTTRSQTAGVKAAPINTSDQSDEESDGVYEPQARKVSTLTTQ